jgi:hypothetical protein
MPCDRCKLPYPEGLLNPVSFGNHTGAGRTLPVCGICALDLSNEILKTRRKAFGGSMAEEYRQRAIRWRERHPDAQPVKA